jgi:hypothetical protein
MTWSDFKENVLCAKEELVMDSPLKRFPRWVKWHLIFSIKFRMSSAWHVSDDDIVSYLKDVAEADDISVFDKEYRTVLDSNENRAVAVAAIRFSRKVATLAHAMGAHDPKEFAEVLDEAMPDDEEK